jgi:adenosylcobinamide-GDP ribazoletransferase
MTDQDQPSPVARESARTLWLSPVGWVTDTGLMLRLLTRLPAPAAGPVVFGGRLARALRTIPLVGAIVGAIGGLAYVVAFWLGLAPLIAAILAVLATLVATGAYHEDGFADTCDGLGGSFDREKKLAIMQDSRHGTFGVAAIVATLLLRVAALATIAEPALVVTALIATHAGARALLPAAMLWGQPAKTDGQGFAAGKPEQTSVWAALAIAAIIALVALGFVALPALAAGAVAGFAMFTIARRQVGGYTGDVLGAIEQVAEIAMLLCLAALL